MSLLATSEGKKCFKVVQKNNNFNSNLRTFDDDAGHVLEIPDLVVKYTYAHFYMILLSSVILTEGESQVLNKLLVVKKTECF